MWSVTVYVICVKVINHHADAGDHRLARCPIAFLLDVICLTDRTGNNKTSVTYLKYSKTIWAFFSRVIWLIFYIFRCMCVCVCLLWYGFATDKHRTFEITAARDMDRLGIMTFAFILCFCEYSDVAAENTIIGFSGTLSVWLSPWMGLGSKITHLQL